jgi:hypothetical protein
VAPDDRKTLKLRPDVGQRFEERKPDELNQSEFVRQLLDEQPAGIGSVEDVREVLRGVLRDELDDFADRLIERLRNNR